MTDAGANPDADGNTNAGGNANGDVSARVLDRPTPEAAVSAIEAALHRDHVVSIVGRCVVESVDGEGAGGDTRPSGERHVLVKPDGSVVIHARSGASPLHRAAGTDDLDVAAVEGRLRIDVDPGCGGSRIEFERVALLSSFPIDGVSEAAGNGRDARGGRHDFPADRHGALRDRLLAHPDLLEPGFQPLSTERETAAGPVDLYGRDVEGRAVVVEIKAHRAGPAAVGQLDRYVSALRRDLHAETAVRGVLVAPSATGRTRTLLSERGFSFRALSPDSPGSRES